MDSPEGGKDRAQFPPLFRQVTDQDCRLLAGLDCIPPQEQTFVDVTRMLSGCFFCVFGLRLAVDILGGRSLRGFFGTRSTLVNLSVGFIDGVTFPLCHPILRIGPMGP
jgi:hypothetical protein